MKNIKFLFSLLVLFVLPGVIAKSHAAITDPLTTIELETPVHFLAPDGSDLVVEAGTYAIEPAEEWIRLMSGERHDAVLIEAKKGTHELALEHAMAMSLPGEAEKEADLHHVMLLLPGGNSLEATGTYSGIRPRGFFNKTFNNVKKQANRAYKKARSTAKKTASKAKNTVNKAKKQVQRSAKKAGSTARKGYLTAKDAALQAKRQVEKTARRVANTVRSIGVNIANLLTRGHFVGPADSRKCSRMRGRNGFGNTRVGRGKFKNFKIGSSYQDMNNYLLMQASLKTYFKHFNFEQRRRRDPKARQLDKMDFPRNEDEYRCAATELYKKWGFTQVYFVNSPQSANAIIASNANMAIITVRGTQGVDNIKDKTSDSLVNGILEDAKGVADIATTVVNATVPFVLPTKKGLKVGQMHVGYAAMTSTFVPLLQHAIEKMRIRKATPIYVTGHSLGASTAALAAFALKILNYKIDAAYVYAPPKVGDLLLNKSIKRTLPLYVTENYRDPVPGIPLLSNVRIQPFFPMMTAAKRSIYFDRQHRAVEFGANVNTLSRERRILGDQGDQGAPPPLLFFRGGKVLSNEWKFHNGNFYTAFTYEKVKNFRLVRGSYIEPEYSQRDNMCINETDTHNTDGNQITAITHSLLMSDKHSNPMRTCKGFTQQLKDGEKNLKKRRNRR